MYNANTIPHLGKHATIISISKLNKDHIIGTNYPSISLLSSIAKQITENIPVIFHQHGFKHTLLCIASATKVKML